MSSMKHDSAAPERYWRSLEDLEGTAEFRELVQKEFPDFSDEFSSQSSRRTFLKIMGASVAMAGMTACNWPTETIVPFAARPGDRIPGVPQRFATAMEHAGVATGLLVTSFDGRPVKVEGNELHPGSLGGTSAVQQAAVLELYDPDRSRRVIERVDGTDAPRTWDELRAAVLPALAEARADGGRGVFVVAEESYSPSLASMRARFQEAFPSATWVTYEAVSRDHVREGARQAFGTPARTHLALEQAAVIVAFDDDFLMDHPTAVRNARGFATSRKLHHGSISRLYVAESRSTVTGAAADRRVAAAPDAVANLAGRVAAKLIRDHRVPTPPGAGANLNSMLDRFASIHDDHDAIVDAMAADLASHRGRSVLTVGPVQPPEVHALVHWINAALDNVGSTVTYTADPGPDRPTHVDALRAFVDAANAGRVDTAIVIGGNPVYDAPADLDVAAAIATATHSVRLGLYDDESSAACRWHAPRAHFLESWGDALGWDGTVTVAQPLIRPLWNGKAPAEFLALLLDAPVQSGHDIAREALAASIEDDFEAGWRRSLHDGLVAGSDHATIEPAPRGGAWVDAMAANAGAAAEGMQVVFLTDAKVGDGRFANSGWLQEMPDPLSKVTWDNAALIAPATAAGLGVAQGDVVAVEVGGRSLELPAHIHPGQPAGTVGVALGYGRSRAGRVGNGVGADAYRIRSAEAPFSAPCDVTPTGARRDLAVTQDHHAIDALGLGEIANRTPMLVREADVAAFAASDHPDEFVEHLGPHLPPDPELQLWKGFDYDGHKWGMSIDLNACIGCGSCTVACMAENNIPVVGPEEVSNGRSMHWLRVDRYYRGDPDDPSVAFQPVTCQHCENAPCESVCPVAATVHDAEGLNVMVYNRCIGTRYCSNNCPYKVRRFNYFNNHKNREDVENMVFNPEVTTRSRGVMEKCTFCTQRIQAAKITAKNEGRPVRDGEITTACEQACPTRAIAFGNLNDPESRVSKAQADPRAYSMLEELNVRPRTRYLTRLRNRGDAADAAGEGHHES